MTSNDALPIFEAAVAQAISLLTAASRQIDQMRPASVRDPVAEYERLHLSTGALLSAHRARHLLRADLLLDEPVVTDGPPVDHVIAAHELLIGQIPGADTLELLKLVSDVGNLCQDLRRHDKLH